MNGAVASAGARVFPGDVVRLDGEPIDWETKNLPENRSTSAFRYVKYWKPRGITCTTDRRDRTNILDAVQYPERVFPVGRLDKDSTGLILLRWSHRADSMRSGDLCSHIRAGHVLQV